MGNNKILLLDLTPEQLKDIDDNIPTPEKEVEHFKLYGKRFTDYYNKSFQELNDRTITLERLKRKRYNFYDLLAKVKMVYRDIFIQKTKPLIYHNLPELNEQIKRRWEYQIVTLEDLITSVNNQIEGFSYRETQAKEIQDNLTKATMEEEGMVSHLPKLIEEIKEDTNKLSIKNDNVEKYKIPFKQPTFRSDMVPQIFEILKVYFNSEQQPLLEALLLDGEKSKEKLLFKGNGKILLDTLKQLMKGQILIVSIQKDLEYWVCENFMYLKNGEPNKFTPKYGSTIISENQRAAKGNRLIDVINEDGKLKIKQLEIKNRQQNEKNL